MREVVEGVEEEREELEPEREAVAALLQSPSPARIRAGLDVKAP
jgi:hypothetical protein